VAAPFRFKIIDKTDRKNLHGFIKAVTKHASPSSGEAGRRVRGGATP
jgi:hypothetical protein